ncbi:D-aminoacyl-tRNA deacylase [Alkalimonas collagenimarina]|uniref:D-aminoacyl-tRNA deacylase n=1 Tax=Alkalimonas collagenimarina TaxID=400390 RepID=A0ABT9GVI3_9GAMM|nr:D-aminoacyl-tRNA deacylase [Alkalimonas collagenimarina]MDP4535048.1 D-aminoacyl-tRNA deacylase [Alkalimonas collagenimarina]
MKALLQRVSSAAVRVNGEEISRINSGLLVLLGVEQQDSELAAAVLADKVCKYRLFADEAGKMNLNVQQVKGQLLVVSQFTLAADTDSGLRPSFTPAAAPELAQRLYQHFIHRCQEHHLEVASGRFAADMQVELVNDGPVTFLLQAGAR